MVRARLRGRRPQRKRVHRLEFHRKLAVGGMRSVGINVAVQEKRRHPKMERVTISVLAAVEGAPCTGVAVSSEARGGGGLALRRFPSIL